MIDTAALAEAIAEIERKLPGWWWSCGNCAREAHACVGTSDERGYEHVGFSVPDDVAGALRHALRVAKAGQRMRGELKETDDA